MIRFHLRIFPTPPRRKRGEMIFFQDGRNRSTLCLLFTTFVAIITVAQKYVEMINKLIFRHILLARRYYCEIYRTIIGYASTSHPDRNKRSRRVSCRNACAANGPAVYIRHSPNASEPSRYTPYAKRFQALSNFRRSFRRFYRK